MAPTSTGLEEASLEGTVPTHRGDRPLVGAAIPGALRCRLRRGSSDSQLERGREGKFEMTLLKLLNTLREVESTIKKEKPILYASETNTKRKANKTVKKGMCKGKLGKKKIAKKHPTKDKGQCFHYSKDGYRRRNMIGL
ncbi:hypothetical protein B296_00001293 [Ensete ventricosum]|uniref:Uncharacterized protein n=1 Tax=Ensete ventricosum TaxID=4639 RepID=A0A427BBU5_ENSVE|nr:hypothetical protein B296_00001293 [Ensete ventricosum]